MTGSALQPRLLGKDKVMSKAQSFFSKDEQVRIEAAVHAAEAQTSGEIVPLVVDASYSYPRAEIVGGGSFALGLALVIAWFWGGSSEWVFFPVFLLLYLPCKWLIRYTPWLRRLLIHPAEYDAEVREKALVSFVEHGIYRTREGTGILILISLFERRVYVLADKGINDQVAPHTWDEVVAIVTAGLRDGRACEALCTAIGRCGELLSANFPRRDDDTNELPNLILGESLH